MVGSETAAQAGCPAPGSRVSAPGPLSFGCYLSATQVGAPNRRPGRRGGGADRLRTMTA